MQSYMLMSRRLVLLHTDLHLCPTDSCLLHEELCFCLTESYLLRTELCLCPAESYLLHTEFKVFIHQIQKELWGTFSQLWGTF